MENNYPSVLSRSKTKQILLMNDLNLPKYISTYSNTILTCITSRTFADIIEHLDLSNIAEFIVPHYTALHYTALPPQDTRITEFSLEPQNIYILLYPATKLFL